MKTNIQVKTQNKYNIKVIRDGEVREEYNFGNTLCKGILSGDAWFGKLLIGKGTGTPSWDDTEMFSQLWQVDLSKISSATQPDGSYKVTFQATIPASSSYVGTITEVGIKYKFSGYLATHALVTDAEGNPISINKTDLDIVIITIDFIVTADIGDAKKQANGEKGISSVIFSMIETSANHLDSKLRIFEVMYGNNLTISMGNSDNVLDQNDRTLKNGVKSKRLGAGDNNGHYFKAIGIAPDCIYDMKDIFTPYTVQGAAIGTGDGATTVFACPLSYFKENTEKIYKNGALLTRGVDYTLDNINNSGAALFIHNDIYTRTTGGEPENKSPSYNEEYVEFFSPNKTYVGGSPEKLPSTYALSKDNPIYLDFGAPRKCNLLHLYRSRYNSGPVTLSYSTDGAAYTPISEITDLQWTEGQELEQTFTPITARYWRLSTSGTKVLFQSNGNDVGDLICSYITHKTDGITFTQAPANGDVLTMDATLDYPFKNDKHVIDINWDCTLTFA